MTVATETYAYHAEGRAAGKPLVFAFHGTGGTEHQFVPLVRELVPGAAIVAPRGDVSEHGALRFFRRTGEGVYDVADLERRTAAMAEFVEAHVERGRPSAVIGLGYSNGANILASVIFRRPTLFGRAALLHPLIPWTPAPAAVTTRVLITAGERDPICPPEETRALADWFRAQGAPVTTEWSPGGHEIGRSEIGAVAAFLGQTAPKQGRQDMAIDPTDITLDQTGSKGRYSYRVGEAEAEMTFSKAGEGLVIIDHTAVPDVFRGQGVGQALVARAVEDARAAGKKILPLCPFAAAQFRRHRDWADVLQGGER